MSYQSGTPSSPADMLAKLATFAAANGWTVTNVAGGGKHFSKSGVEFGIAATGTDIATRGCNGVATGSLFDAQPNHSGVTHAMTLGAGPFSSYTVYSSSESSGEQLHLVIEISSGVYRHWTSGSLVKYGTWTGGQYTDSMQLDPSNPFYANYPFQGQHRYIFDSDGASLPLGQIRADIDGATNNWLVFHQNWATNHARGDIRTSGMHGSLANQIGYQRWNLMTTLYPIEIAVNRPGNLYSLAGRVPNMRSVSMRNLSPGQVLNIGGDDWQCWPLIARTDTWNVFSAGPVYVQSSAYMGIAIKRL